MSVHTVGGALHGVSLGVRNDVDDSFPKIYERDFFESTEISDYESKSMKASVLHDQQDDFYDMLMALETNFNLEGEGLQDEDNLASVSTN